MLDSESVLSQKIREFVTGVQVIKFTDTDWFEIVVKGCVFPDDLIKLAEIVRISHVSCDIDFNMVINCKKSCVL